MRTRPTLLLALLLCCTTHAHAQQTAATSGGDATGTGGMVSWTLGQSAYEPTTGSGGSVYRGVQQPYEWLVTGHAGAHRTHRGAVAQSHGRWHYPAMER